MASDANKSYNWGILGCGWLGQALCMALQEDQKTCWGTGQSTETLQAIAATGGDAIQWKGGPFAVSTWPETAFLLVALPPSAGELALDTAATLSHEVQHTVLISSTSVYPAEQGRYRESDAIRRISPHSGACLLDIEGQFDPARTTILRAGGLFGPGRHPRGFLRGRPLTNPAETVNMVHQQDVVRAILHAAEQRLAGPFNVVSPIQTSRSTFYAAAGAVPCASQEQALPQGRHILSEALLETGFTFLHPDPAKAVLSLT